MEWGFIEERLRDASLPEKMITVIMGILRRSPCTLFWNGESTEAVYPTRGLRQGDPLSPYIFVMCMERLSRWVHERVEQGRWKLLKALRGGAVVSYLFFTDDILFFAKEGEDQVECIMEGIKEFSSASGQKINLNKSSILFSSNLSNRLQED